VEGGEGLGDTVKPKLRVYKQTKRSKERKRERGRERKRNAHIGFSRCLLPKKKERAESECVPLD
jgi:hypothetical protein